MRKGPSTWADRQLRWARDLMAALADSGVAHVVISPGSRSTPFALAAVREPRLTCHSVIDERSAAFFALGQGKATGRPSLLLCTSGSAGANYFPAVVEASASHGPLLVLTADRPVELVACAANQTIDQLKLFGDHARAFFDLALADDVTAARRGLARTAAQAVFRTTWPEPGPVHLNARARKPLEPEALGADSPDTGSRPRTPRPARPVAAPRVEDVDALATALVRTRRGLLIAGPAPMGEPNLRPLVSALGRAAGMPLLCEATSQLRLGPADRYDDAPWVDVIEPLVRHAAFAKGAPDLILQVGRPPTSGGLLRYLSRHAERGDVRHWVIAEHGWNDAENTATDLLTANLGVVLKELTYRLPSRPSVDPEWTRRWVEGGRLAAAAVDDALAAVAAGGALSEGAVARLAVESVPEGGILALGNSLVVRQIDTWGGAAGAAGVEVWHQRGASGIDGLVSGAAGAAQATGRPTLLVLGDVSLLHDVGGLALLTGAGSAIPLVVLAVDNDGGRIFEQLPVAAADGVSGSELDLWLTPHGRDLTVAADLYGVPHRTAGSVAELDGALRDAFASGGPFLVVAKVPPHGAAEENRDLRRRVAEALGETGRGSP
ncbi:MAG: 2-succinyl-5-enolpyruvyl-6-hydroxy-3-cyclohexene-1-carboxylic-acid synthase [Acidobacteriota bacterium]